MDVVFSTVKPISLEPSRAQASCRPVSSGFHSLDLWKIYLFMPQSCSGCVRSARCRAALAFSVWRAQEETFPSEPANIARSCQPFSCAILILGAKESENFANQFWREKVQNKSNGQLNLFYAQKILKWAASSSAGRLAADCSLMRCEACNEPNWFECTCDCNVTSSTHWSGQILMIQIVAKHSRW